MVGRSNVGKSSLINAVLKRKAVARVSQTPGKTQAIQFYLINERFYIVDFPGYGYAKVPKDIARSWGELVRGYLESADALKLIFILLDVRRTPSPEDRQMHDWTTASGIDERILLTKSDKLSNNQLVEEPDGDRPRSPDYRRASHRLFRHQKERDRTSPARDLVAPLNQGSFNQRGLNQCPKQNSKTNRTSP